MTPAAANLRELRTVTISQAAERLNVGIEMLRGWCLAGNVRYFQFGRYGTYHIVETDLVAYVQSQLRGQAPVSDDADEAPVEPRRARGRKALLVAAASQALDGQDDATSAINLDALLPPDSERVFSRRDW